MRRNEKLLRLASVLEICDEHDLTDDCVFMYCCKCVNDLADRGIEAVQRQLDKPEIRSCRIPLVIDFEKMTNPDYWLKSKLFCEALSERSPESCDTRRHPLRPSSWVLLPSSVRGRNRR